MRFPKSVFVSLQVMFPDVVGEIFFTNQLIG